MYRKADVLLIDDIQFFQGKEQTQEQFFHTFNELYTSGKQIVMTADRYPGEMVGLQDRLLSRFESGLIADINPPDLETKVAILYKKAEAHKKKIPQDAAIFIASNIKSNIRELEGFLLRVIAYSSFTHRKINLDLTKEVLKDFTFDKSKNFTIQNILKTVAEFYNVKVSEIIGFSDKTDLSNCIDDRSNLPVFFLLVISIFLPEPGFVAHFLLLRLFPDHAQI